MKKYIVVIDTDQYSGNFERELCAYTTGVLGECGVGRDKAKEYQASNLPNLEEEVRQVADEHGCFRPVKIYPTPGVFNSGMGIHYVPTPLGKAEALQKHKKAVKDYYTPYLKQVQDRIAQKSFNDSWTEEGCKREEQRYLKEIAKAQQMTEPQQFPAYQSVAIFFHNKPTKTLVEQIKTRAHVFCQNNQIKITGFRLIEETLNSKAINL